LVSAAIVFFGLLISIVFIRVETPSKSEMATDSSPQLIH